VLRQAGETRALGLACSASVGRRLRWASTVATVVLVVLVAWFTVQFVTDGTWYGVSERVVIVAQSVWPIVVAVARPGRFARGR
jgi:hypothetical protein